MRKNTKKPATNLPAAEIPRELAETPREHSYSIMMVDEIEGTDIEQIEVSRRQEYLAIKRMLIEMRGYAVPEVVHA